ncbi:MAG: glutathione peroxidase [Myxococcota bacterium]|jgi:glutathione peroxidase
MFAKINVNGPDTAPVYQFLRDSSPDHTGEELPWNFTKFLVGRDGSVLARFEPQTTPEQIGEKLAALL